MIWSTSATKIGQIERTCELIIHNKKKNQKKKSKKRINQIITNEGRIWQELFFLSKYFVKSTHMTWFLRKIKGKKLDHSSPLLCFSTKTMLTHWLVIWWNIIRSKFPTNKQGKFSHTRHALFLHFSYLTSYDLYHTPQ